MQQTAPFDFYRDNPLVQEVLRVLVRLEVFREEARAFYYEVLLSCCSCPECGGRLRMIGDSRCLCDAGHAFDPTVAFQGSECCGARLVRRVLHYECVACRGVVRSRFLFDERLFDASYFKEMMRDSRARAREKREEIRLLLLGSRSRPLDMTDLPDIQEIPGLGEALDLFVGYVASMPVGEFAGGDVFDMDQYRRVILQALTNYTVWFDALPPVSVDPRRDRVRRFVTLVYLEHEGLVDLAQRGERIVVTRHEADIEG